MARYTQFASIETVFVTLTNRTIMDTLGLDIGWLRTVPFMGCVPARARSQPSLLARSSVFKTESPSEGQYPPQGPAGANTQEAGRAPAKSTSNTGPK